MTVVAILILGLVLAAVGLGGWGVFLLLGAAWTLIFAAACCAALAGVLIRGLNHG